MAPIQHRIRAAAERLYDNPDSWVARRRNARMVAFLRLVKPPSDARILDLGGTPDLWSRFPNAFHVTMVNLRRPDDAQPSDRLEFVEADATDLGDLFADRSFDVVFSNSVIEHVGDAAKRAAFAGEVLRHAPAHWVQTPSQYFPIEPHSGVPFFFQLPRGMRERKMSKWDKTMPEWTDMIRGTVSVPKKEMAGLFKGDALYVERVGGLAKSISFYRAVDGSGVDDLGQREARGRPSG